MSTNKLSADEQLEQEQQDQDSSPRPVVHIISDSLGATATEVLNAAAAQFPQKAVTLSRLSRVKSLDQVISYIETHHREDVPSAVFHTIVDPELRSEVRRELRDREIPSIDLLGPAITVLSTLTGLEPQNVPGALRKTDKHYFHRVAGMEFFVDHDNGQKLSELHTAQAVLVGPSRTSKSPLSMYLAFMGYRVANLPLDSEHGIPDELKAFDPQRIFGLIPSQDVEDDPDQSRALELMRELGCKIIENKDKTIEEVATEITKYLD